jgi:hypothetical protein
LSSDLEVVASAANACNGNVLRTAEDALFAG